jgi:hypothetical protein
MKPLPPPTLATIAAHRHANRGHRHSVRALFGATRITDADRRSRAMVESPQQWISPKEWASYSSANKASSQTTIP